jgi:hemerythrin
MFWDKKYETGIKIIDDQHMQWIFLTKKLLDAMLTGTIKEELDVIFWETFQYSQTHLKYEETLMEQYNFPGLKRHKELHANLLIHLESIKSKIESNLESEESSSEDAINLCQVFQKWLIDHIENEDKKYIPFINKEI